MKYMTAIVCLLLFSCTSTQQGAAGGAIVGVGVGAIAGGGSGALIGGAVGAAGGAIIGAALDDSDRDSLQHESPDTLKKIDEKKHLSTQDIVNMSKAGLSDDVIISQIKATKSTFSLSSQEIIDLKNQGVSQSVIDAMIQTKS